MKKLILFIFMISLTTLCFATGDTIEDPVMVSFTDDYFSETGTTTTFQNDYTLPGTNGDDNDVVYQFSLTEHKAVTISLENSSYDTKLALYEEGVTPAADNYITYSNTFWNGSAWVDQSLIDAVSLLPGTYVAVIDGEGSTPTGDYQIDITLETPPLPEAASSPVPAHNAFYVPVDQILNWSNSNYTTGIEIYFGTDPEPPLIDTFDELIETYDPGILEFNTVYYWKVVCTNGSGNSESEVWSFRTNPEGDPDYYLVERFNTEIPAEWSNDGGWSWIEYYDSWGTHYTIDGTPLIYTDADAELITTVIDASGLENLYLEYDEVLADYPTNSHLCQIQVFDGNEWVIAYTHPGGNLGSWYSTAHHMQLDISEYINDQLQVKFFHDNIDGSWTSYWTVDNVIISSPPTPLDDPVPPENIFALPNEADTECLVTWEPPGAFADYEIAYDDGEETTSSIYFNAGQGSAVRFTPLGYPCTLQEAQIHVSDGSYGTLPSDFAVVIYDDDGADGMPGTELAWIDVTADQFFWNYFDISTEEIVIESGDFYICYLQTGTMMTSLPHPASENDPSGRSYYVIDSSWTHETDHDYLIRTVVTGPQGERVLASDNHLSLPVIPTSEDRLSWQKNDPQQAALIQNFLQENNEYNKAAYDLDQQLNKMKKPSSTSRSISANPYRTLTNYNNTTDRDLTGYSVWRLVAGEEEDPGSWIELAENISDTLYVDTGWIDLETGLYRYAIKTNYTNDVISEAAFSNVVAKNMYTSVTFNLTTNSGDSPAGAMITLTCQDSDPDHFYELEAETATVTFPEIWRGMYDIEVDLTGFEIYQSEEDLTADGTEVDVSLTEILAPPLELTATTAYAEVSLNWLTPGTLTSLYERFDNGVFPPEDWHKYELADAGGFELSDENNSPYGNGSAFHSDLNHDCNDWLVSPQVTLTTETELTFYEMNQYLPNWYEHHGLWVSTGSADPADGQFELVQEFDQSYETWTEQVVDLAVYADTPIYIAFKYTGFYATRWYIDDVATGIPASSRSLLGYNIFRDDVQLNDELITVTTFVDTDIPTGTYTYSVTAEYTTGSSDPVVLEDIEVEGTNAENQIIPDITELRGNYPNPFNPSTVISFTVAPEDAYNASLKIYNMKGQLIRTFEGHPELVEGRHSITWNGKDESGNKVSSGVYFYKLEAGVTSKIKKMMLLQ